MENWVEIQTAYQVAKLGTVSAAAQALGVHRVTVNRHVETLEAKLGTKLFLRHGRGYVLTEQGQDFLSVVTRADNLLNDFAGRARMQNAELSGELILTTTPALSHMLMRPIVSFRKQHPGVRVTVLNQYDLLKLEYGEAHIALHVDMVKPGNPDYVVSLFKNAKLGLHAHESYIQRMGMPETVEDFKHHDFIRNLERFADNDFHRWLDDNVPADRFVVHCEHPRIALEAVTAGVGIGFLPNYQAKHNAQMQRIKAVQRNWDLPVWLVTHVDLHRTEKVQSMLRFMREEYDSFLGFGSPDPSDRIEDR